MAALYEEIHHRAHARDATQILVHDEELLIVGGLPQYQPVDVGSR